MNYFAEDTDRARSKSEAFFEFLIGCLKLLVILSPAWLLALMFVGGTSNCTGDCGVGIGMLILFGAAYLGPPLLLIGLPIVFGLLILWTRKRPTQLLGGIAFIPLLLVAWWGFSYVRDAVISYRMEAAIRPEYLDRTISKPVGELQMLVFVGEGGGCFENCYETLVNGISAIYSNGHLNNNGGNQKFFEKTFEISRGDACRSEENFVRTSIEYLQSRGIFDICIIEARSDPPTKAIAIRGFNYDRNVLGRPYGLQGVQVLQAMADGTLGQELVRWEYGTLPGSRKRIGTPVQWEDLVRAYTGISTDRFADAEKLDHSRRLDAILSSAGTPPLQIYPVFQYLREAKDASEFRFARKNSSLRQLTDEEATKLRAIGTRICSTTPVVDSHSSKPTDCPKAYNDLIRKAYPGQAGALML